MAISTDVAQKYQDNWLSLRPGRRQHRRQSTKSLPAAFRVSLVLVFGAPVDPRGSVIFGGVWLSDDGASDACRARLRRWQFGGDQDLVVVLPELSSALNLLNLES